MAKMLGAVTKRVAKRAVALSKAKTLAEAELNIGEDRTAIRSRRQQKRTPTEAGAKSQGEVMQSDRTLYRASASKAHMRPALPVSRGMPTAPKASTPHARAVGRPMFIVVEGSGGHREEGGPCVRRLRSGSWVRRARDLNLRLVVS